MAKAVLGLDVGLAKMGFALLSKDCQILDSGIIVTSKRLPISARWGQLVKDLAELGEEWKERGWELVEVSAEKTFLNPKMATSFYGVQGAVGAVCAHLYLSYSIATAFYTPQAWKAAIGNGNAKKSEVKCLLLSFYGMLEDVYAIQRIKTIRAESGHSDDECDAIGIALASMMGATKSQ